MRWKKSYKIIAVSVAIILLAQVVVFSMESALWSVKSSAEGASTSEMEVERIAAEISNMSGVPVEEIISLYNSGLSWNEITDKLKVDAPKQDNNQEQRDLLLMESGLSESAIAQLKDEGFSEDEILEAKLIAERVAFQLRQLLEEKILPSLQPSVAFETSDESSEELAPFRNVASRFEIESAVRWMLTVHEDFGSADNALNEYLAALQYELNLEDYHNNKQKYAEDKEQRKLGKSLEIQVSIAEIERRLLLKIQSDNERQQDALPTTSSMNSSELPKTDSPLPEVQLPKIESPIPANPAESIMKELETINPNNNQY